jgi:hypothetical protein
MMAIYYSVVGGDPLTSGPDSYVVVERSDDMIEGEDGIARPIALIGDEAWCSACRSAGIIVGGAPVDDSLRMLDMVNGGRLQAVSGDRVACKCAEPPRIVAQFGCSWTIHECGGDVSEASTRTATPTYDEQFRLVDANDVPLANCYYIIHGDSGREWCGYSDLNGLTDRIATDTPELLSVTVHRQKDRPYE